jgi:hypothetical protein
MRVMKKAVLVLPASAILLLGLAGAVAPAARAAASGSARAGLPDGGYTGACGQGNPPHWYGLAESGTGSHGTAANIWTWTNWSVDSAGKNFSNEAVWLSDPNEIQYDLEVGFYSGWLSANINGNGPWYTNGMLPYYSKINGTYVYVKEGAYLPASTYIGLAAFFSGATDYAVVTPGGQHPAYMDQAISGINSYQDQADLANVEQGEVTDTKTWMGGGSGDSMTLFWVDYQGGQHPWSYLSYCYNSPYWASSSNNTDYFANGGY